MTNISAEQTDRPALDSVQLKIGGMSCSFCSNAIERGLGQEKGIEEIHVSLAHEEALVRFRPNETDETRIKDVLRSLGYIVRDPRKVGAFDEQRDLKRKEGNDLLSAAGLALAMFGAMAAMWLDLWRMQDWHAWIAWAMATFVYGWNGRRIADAVKPDARDAIAELMRWGITPAMLTGDNARMARAVAGQVGIENIHAQIVPQDKAARIRELQEQGTRVAMIGDGINDAPALMQAHVGIAIGAGTDIAIESADVVLVGERLSAVPEAIAIGGMSYRKTVQNLWLAFVFNGVGVPTAATGILHPSWAMGAMAASVTLVLANSFGGRILKGGKAQMEHVPREPVQRPGETAKEVPATDAALRLFVPTIHCQGCVETITANLGLEDGIDRVDGSATAKTVDVTYRAADISPADIESTVARLGHRVEWTRQTNRKAAREQ